MHANIDDQLSRMERRSIRFWHNTLIFCQLCICTGCLQAKDSKAKDSEAWGESMRGFWKCLKSTGACPKQITWHSWAVHGGLELRLPLCPPRRPRCILSASSFKARGSYFGGSSVYLLWPWLWIWSTAVEEDLCVLLSGWCSWEPFLAGILGCRWDLRRLAGG